jgi:hypothetical protein
LTYGVSSWGSWVADAQICGASAERLSCGADLMVEFLRLHPSCGVEDYKVSTHAQIRPSGLGGPSLCVEALKISTRADNLPTCLGGAMPNLPSNTSHPHEDCATCKLIDAEEGAHKWPQKTDG